MKKRKLNIRGKVLFTVLTIIVSAVIWRFTADFGGLAVKSGIYELLMILAWLWLLIGQIGAYLLIWMDGEM